MGREELEGLYTYSQLSDNFRYIDIDIRDNQVFFEVVR